MEKEDQDLINLLKCFIHNEECSLSVPQNDEYWRKLFLVSEIHSVSGIVGFMLLQNPNGIRDAELEKARYMCHKTMAQYTMRSQRMDILSRKLSREGISLLLFKGYVLKDLYPVPELRTYGDIDFLIHPTDREKTHRLMLQWGYTPETDWEPVFSYRKGSEYYEIHTDVMEVDVSDQADYKGYFSCVWEHATERSTGIYELTPAFHLLYLLTHIAKHISGSGAGIRLYMDIAVFLERYRDEIDWQAFKAELEKLHFSSFANVVFTLVERFFGEDSPIALSPVQDAVMDSFMDFTMEAGVFGHFNRDAGLVTLKNDNRNEASVSKGTALRRRLFPSAESIQSRYTYLQRMPWLLPFAWFHRFFLTRKSWREHTQEMQSILNTEDEAVLNLKRIYKEIGL